MPSFGTSETLGSLPLFSAFRLGRLAGGGIRRAEATLPRDCRPWRGGTTNNIKSANSTDGTVQVELYDIQTFMSPSNIVNLGVKGMQAP